MDCKLKIGQWVDAFEGIGQVLSIHDFFVEEFSPEAVKGQEIGDFLRTIVVYKMLCDFDGKIRKRKLILSCNANMCSPISQESQLIINSIQAEKTEIFRKYLDFKDKKPLGELVDIWFSLPIEHIKEIQEKIAIINNELNTPFTYPTFVEKVNQHYVNIDLNSMHDQDRQGISNFIISFYNQELIVRNKRCVFSGVKGIQNTKG